MAPFVITTFMRTFAAVFTAILMSPMILSAAVTYTYDSRHRLTGAVYDNGATVSYTYDSLGNRLSNIMTGVSRTIYEDAEDGAITGWDIYDQNPTGAIIENIYDSVRQSRVISLTGSATSNGYRLRKDVHGYWDETSNSIIEWSMQYSESYVIYIAAQTTEGFRYIYYTPSEQDNLGTSTYIHHGLGTASRNGTWQTFIRDLEYDLKEAQPDNNLEAVLGFLIRGTGRVDDIKTLSSLPSTLDSDLDTIPDVEEVNIYGTSPYEIDSDGDGMNDNSEIEYWGSSWNADIDGDGLINLLDHDSDGDSMNDGAEVEQGTDPGDGSSYPTTIVYENGEDGTTIGWGIYDSDPAGAIIDNVYDSERDSRVIELTGSATANGYRLQDKYNAYWNDSRFKIMQWSMNYSENFIVYIAAQTTEGFRYIYYTPSERSNLGDGIYIHHGLGGQAKNGTWQTFIRDLEYDLKEAQPDNNLTALQGFLIRGSGMVDDIMTRDSIPPTQDSDGDSIVDADELGLYGSHPYKVDSDSDMLDDGDELVFWGADWNGDPDTDSLISLIDPDSDGDGILDGMEVSEGADPADPTSFPTTMTYEDGDNSTLAGWDIYDGDPVGATITSVFDNQKNSEVIEFNGTAASNGYRLRSRDFSYWYDSTFKVIEWSMRYAEGYVVYIAAQTTDGFRYIYYTSAETDNLGTGIYVHHGLGSRTLDGDWHTISRDLESDLKDAQPDNELEAILGFLIRGSGRVDDIRTREALP